MYKIKTCLLEGKSEHNGILVGDAAYPNSSLLLTQIKNQSTTKEKSQSTDILLEHCEDAAIENSETILAGEISASTNNLAFNNIDTSARTKDSRSENQEALNSTKVPLSAEIENAESESLIFKHSQLPWYRNWTYAGIMFCVVYNLAIVVLLIMSIFKFGRD